MAPECSLHSQRFSWNSRSSCVLSFECVKVNLMSAVLPGGATIRQCIYVDFPIRWRNVVSTQQILEILQPSFEAWKAQYPYDPNIQFPGQAKRKSIIENSVQRTLQVTRWDVFAARQHAATLGLTTKQLLTQLVLDGLAETFAKQPAA